MKFSKKFVLIGLVAAFIIALAAFMFTRPVSTAPAQADNSYKVEELSGELSFPWGMVFLPDGSLLITERSGGLKHFRNGKMENITGVPNVYFEGQGGLLDVALDPDYSTNHNIYLSYSAEQDGLKGTEIYKARLNGARLEEGKVIFRASPKTAEGANHFGSRLIFDRDGYLYASIGERYEHRDEAQNTKSHLGSIVRLDRDGSVPDDSAFPNGIFSYGVRNVQGMFLHPESGKIWFHEHGPRGGDEINILQKGANYGWPDVTYGIDYNLMPISDKTEAPGIVKPLHQWTPSIAPSGFILYTGDKFPEWKGNLFLGTLAGQHLRRVVLKGQNVTKEYELLTEMSERIRDVDQGPDGYIYVLTDSQEGRLLRLVPSRGEGL